MSDGANFADEPLYDENGQLIEKDSEGSRTAGIIRRNAPTFMISLAMHLLILLIISLIPTNSVKPPDTTVIVSIDVTNKEDMKAPPEVRKLELDTKKIDVNAKIDSEVSDVKEDQLNVEESFDEISKENDTAEAMPALETNDEIVEAMPNTLGLRSNMAVSRLLHSGYGNRFGKGKGKANKQHGGDGATSNAVDAALRWLAEHQEPDGSWMANKYEGENTEHFNATALACLPFLGAGHSENIGQYKKTVRGAIRMLNKLVQEKMNGNPDAMPLFGRNYGSGIGLMTLSEASLFGSSAMTKKNADLIANMFVDMYKKDSNGGWGYTGGGEDLSVSGWVALGLKSAKAAGLKGLQREDAKVVFEKYRKWIDEVMTNYDSGEGTYRPDRQPRHKYGVRNMTWVAMFQKQFLGFPRSDPFLEKASENSLKKGWVDDAFTGDKVSDSYALYYGTLAAFQQQGQLWQVWNTKMKPYLVGLQCKGDPKDKGGSWDPGADLVSKQGGRVMVTAMMALCLEVYYRYDMMN